MAKFFDSLDDKLTAFIAAQKMFFVASAPGDGRVNVSPKGLDSFRILGPNKAAYLDLTGSGNETSAHLRDNGRITIMFCAFDGAPQILRLFGQGQVVTAADAAWADLSGQFPDMAGTRQIITIDFDLVQTACGMGVPLYDYVEDRRSLSDVLESWGETRVQDYQRNKNSKSIDGLSPHPLPAFDKETP